MSAAECDQIALDHVIFYKAYLTVGSASFLIVIVIVYYHTLHAVLRAAVAQFGQL